MIRPITLWPFPSDCFARYAEQARVMLSVEMSMGQMVEDVRLAVQGRCPVAFYGRTGGMIPTPKEVLAQILQLAQTK